MLLYFGLGAAMHGAAVRSWAIDTIPQRSELATVTQAITTALAANPNALNESTPAITTAVKDAVTSIAGSRSVKRAIARAVFASAATSRSVLIDPSDTRSGLTPVQETMSSVKLINAYRRRGWAYFERVSYVPAAGGAEVPSPAKVTDFEVPPISGTSGLIGTFVDIMYGNNAYSQISTSPVSLPLNPSDAKQTTYKLTTVGLGAYKGDADSITSDQERGLRYVAGKTILCDFVIPLVLNVLLTAKGEQIDDYLEWLNGSAVVGDLINTLFVAAPGIWDKAYAGDMRGAVWDAYQAIQTSATVKLVFLEMLRQGFSNIKDANQFTDYAGTFLNVLALGDMILTAIDSAVQVCQVSSCDRADIWTITVNGSKVKLTPATASIMPDEKATFHAAVPDATGSGESPVLAYRWSCTGAYGSLTDSMHSGNSFDSSSADVDYKPKGAGGGSDTVSVEVFLVAGGTRTSLGTASAKVTVQKRDDAPSIYPRKVSVLPGGSQGFTTRLTATGMTGTITYRWSTPGAYGTLSQGVKEVETSASAMNYVAQSGVEGTDTIRVEAFLTTEGKKRSLGAATATVAVEKRRSIVMGSFEVEGKDLPNNKFSIGAFVIIPKVEGAEHYSVNCYGFNDWAYYGTSLSLSGPPFAGAEDRGSAWYDGISGMGGDGRITEGDMNWYRARFSGMVVEVTVTYAD